MQEIGFRNLRGFILANGELDDCVEQTTRYIGEKKRVRGLISALYDLVDLPIQSQSILRRLIKKELHTWWSDSWFNIQIDEKRQAIMSCLIHELSAYNVTVYQVNATNVIIDVLFNNNFEEIQKNIGIKCPGLIFYYEPVDCEEDYFVKVNPYLK